MKRKRKIFTVKLTVKELFAVTELVHREIEWDRERMGGEARLPLLADERAALYAVIRKADRAIMESHPCKEGELF